MATGKERIGRFLALNLVFAMHSDSHAASMVDCGIEGGVLISETVTLQQFPNYPTTGVDA